MSRFDSKSVSDKKVKLALQDSQLRIQAMSLIHETLYGSDNLSSINMKSYLLRLIRSLEQSYANNLGKVKIVVETSDIVLGVKYATPLGLIVNELVSNSYKYAFPDGRKGQIKMQLQVIDSSRIELV